MSNNKVNTQNKKTGRSPRQVLGIIIKSIVLAFLITIVLGIVLFYATYGRRLIQMQKQVREMVDNSTYDTFKAAQTSLVYDSDGNVISTIKTEKDVYYLDYKDIPSYAVEAMLVSEDRKFLKHKGVDYLAILRALIALVKHNGKITQGASTITQQVARNVFLTQEVTYERKIKEIFTALELEKKYTKDDILEFYLNNIYFANGYYGIQAASNGYFNKSVKKLSLSQIVFLCSIPNNPNQYNPVKNMQNTLNRRDRILQQMYEDGKIDQTEYWKAFREKIKLGKQKPGKKNYEETYIYHCAIEALMARQGFEFQYQFDDDQEEKNYQKEYDDLYHSCQQDLLVSGYRIYTSIDEEKQRLLQDSVDQTLQKFTEKSRSGVYRLQGAAVCIDNDTGRVVAIVGGRGQKQKGYPLNRAFQSFRQPGSAIKPLIVYTPVFERGYTPDSMVSDEKFEGGPDDAGNSYAGEMKLSRAIALSKNTVAWKLFEQLKPVVGLSYLLNMDFSKIDPRDNCLAASLGGLTYGVSPLEMAAAYAALENDGNYRKPTCIYKIMDARGNEIVGDAVEEKKIYKTEAARVMTEMLTGVIKNGTGKGLGLKNTVSAGKTGTTNERKDGWFVGYTPYYTTSTWVGYDLPKRLENLCGASYPGAIWHKYMETIHDASMKKTFEPYDWKAETEPKETATK
jgi:penicillin-binding protein 1A